MPRVTPDEALRKMKEQEARIKAKIQRAEARKRERDRKHRTQKAVLAGLMVLDRVERGELTEKLFLRDMDQFLTRDRERAVFGLPPRQNHEKGEPQP